MKKMPEPPYREGEHTQMALMAQDIKYIKETIIRVENVAISVQKEVEEKYVTNVEFEPIKRLVYGLVTLILVAVVTAVMALVIKK